MAEPDLQVESERDLDCWSRAEQASEPDPSGRLTLDQ